MRFYCYSVYAVLCLAIILTIIYSTLQDIKNNMKVTQQRSENIMLNISKNKSEKVKDMKYILVWTDGHNVPLVYMGKGQDTFLAQKCTYVNCFVTTNRTLLGSYKNFDVIVFAGTELTETDFPKTRSAHQKYVFASIESAANYEQTTDTFDNYFNWTWTYKLDSDIRWGYIVVRDLKNTVIGPKKDMNWLKIEEMDPVADDFKQKLKSKRRAAAWFVSNCQTQSRREWFIGGLREELLKYRLSLDVYGKCGIHVCSRDNEEACNEKISRNYYFYMAFENSFSEDYVTEKLLRALNNDAVPIVYGGANYTKFMPNGIYLDALALGVKKLAAKMNEHIHDPEKYMNFFRWKNHYKFEKTTDNVDTNEYCRMCAILNDQEAVKNITVYEDFQQWWNPINKN